jgi:hypothetical protein
MEPIDGDFAVRMNALREYVVSTTLARGSDASIGLKLVGTRRFDSGVVGLNHQGDAWCGTGKQ